MNEFLEISPPPVSTKRNYPLLLAGQFLSAFGDNAVLAVIIGQLTFLKNAGAITDESLRTTSSIYTVLPYIPCVLLAPVAGFINDRFAKTTCLVGGNALKLFGALICAMSLFFDSRVQGVGYFVIGIGACIYCPAKYGVLPEILPREKLVRGNGAVEMLTLLAVLVGAIGGGILADRFRDARGVSFAIIGGIYALSFALNFLMKKTPAYPTVKLNRASGEFFGHLRDLVSAPRICRLLVGTALFWICGAAMKTHFQPWGLEVLGLKNNTSIAMLGLWLSIGVMAGSILAGRLHKLGDLRGIPFYGLALAGMFALAYSVEFFDFWKTPVYEFSGINIVAPVVLLLIAAGLFAGLFLIPMNAALQAETDPAKMGKTIAVQNFFDNIGMCFAGLYLVGAVKIGLSTSGVFLGLAIGTAAVVGAMRIHRKARG